MKVSDRRKFEKANFDEFESALNNKNDLVHCPSITLFESIPTEVLVILRRRTRFPGRTNPFKVSYSQENQLDGLHVVSSAYFEIQ
ncbi:BPG_G0016880.mRNA.1.CDS.1 [Saccharomyces cerevisiae]|nr:BPG_G0016880.mRNA.1.CDS.1 [Saccharomyces cerevisiae]CAI7109719.1 BPG_G0016880.mRNA.1.CDS.1 [Saccharomyces cerevisiae]